MLDSFCGSATVGVEAVRLGRRFIGVDSNPIAMLIGNAKLYFPEPRSVRESLALDTLWERYATWDSSAFEHPNREVLMKWYHRGTYNELSFLICHIASIRSTQLRSIGQAIFSSILKSTSSQYRHWGWVCDNVTPKKHELRYKDAIGAFQKAAYAFLQDSVELLGEVKKQRPNATRAELRALYELACGDCNSFLKDLPAGSVHLVLSSPPYYGVADYVKSQRLSFLWFDKSVLPIEGFGSADFEALRQRETGSRSYRRRQNSFSSYLDYMAGFMRETHRVLQSSGKVVLVIGESSSRRKTIDDFISMSQSYSFQLAFRSEREIRKTRRRLMAKVEDESILVFEKA